MSPATRHLSQSAIHSTVWQQMQMWLDNLELAFPREALPLRDWLPIVEAGLANLTVGVIPPALDQVLVGAIDRSRNPNLKLALVLGVNEGVFPAAPPAPTILTETDRDALRTHASALGPDIRERLARERYYGYIACTRASERLVLTCADRDEQGQKLNPSPFLAHLRQIFPALVAETFSASGEWPQSEHVSELVPALLRNEVKAAGELITLVTPVVEKWSQWQSLPGPETLTLSRSAVETLYGNELRSSVSALETFAACPFQFFARYGLRADERKLFETDPRQAGSLQHEVLAEFHRRLKNEGKRWRDLTPPEAREWIARIGGELSTEFAGGLFEADERSRFLARALIDRLQNVVETLVAWMGQYEFDPHEVELAFGLKPGDAPGWKLELGQGRALVLRGKIDRVDLSRGPGTDPALIVVMDYKSGGAKLDPVLLHHGLELQLLGYLGALRHWKEVTKVFGTDRLAPAGAFYVPLRARAESAGTRDEVIGEPGDAARGAYQHAGCFDAAALRKLDTSGAPKGIQFKYAINQDGSFRKSGNDALPPEQFRALLDQIESHLRRHGENIFAGHAEARPYRKNRERACEWCAFATTCRFDPWLHPFNVLRKPAEPKTPPAAPKRKRAKA